MPANFRPSSSPPRPRRCFSPSLMRAANREATAKPRPPKPMEITIAPGGRVSAWLRVDRHGNDAILSLDVDGLPHGIIVDSIGLNGVQIRANETEREIFLSCESWVPDQDRLIQVVTGNAGAVESVEGLQDQLPGPAQGAEAFGDGGREREVIQWRRGGGLSHLRATGIPFLEQISDDSRQQNEADH